MKQHTQFLVGIALLLIALASITAGCGVSWGTSGALIGAGIISAIYGFIALQKLDV